MNEFKFNEAIEYIESHQDEWDQSDWASAVYDEDDNLCGTACCLAGHVALLNGWKLQYNELGEPSTKVKKDGRVRYISDVGRVELEISPRQADFLFHGYNKLETLKKLGKEILNGEHEDNSDELAGFVDYCESD